MTLSKHWCIMRKKIGISEEVSEETDKNVTFCMTMVEWRGRRGTRCLEVGSRHRNETSKTKKVPNPQELIAGNGGHYPHLITLNKKPLDVLEFHFNTLASASSPSPKSLPAPQI